MQCLLVCTQFCSCCFICIVTKAANFDRLNRCFSLVRQKIAIGYCHRLWNLCTGHSQGALHKSTSQLSKFPSLFHVSNARFSLSLAQFGNTSFDVFFFFLCDLLDFTRNDKTNITSYGEKIYNFGFFFVIFKSYNQFNWVLQGVKVYFCKNLQWWGQKLLRIHSHWHRTSSCWSTWNSQMSKWKILRHMMALSKVQLASSVN